MPEKDFVISHTKPIFVAVPEDWRNPIESWLINEGFLVEMASSRGDALRVLNYTSWGGFVVVSDWAIDKTESTSLIERIQGKIPTVTIINKEAHKKDGWLIVEKVYLSAAHQFCTTPFSQEELIGSFHRARNAFEATQ